jgi:hypothetical protein
MNSHHQLIASIEKCTYPATLKAADSGKYLVSNLANARHFGMPNPGDMVGLTVRDLNFSHPVWGKRFVRETESIDARVRDQGAVETEHRSILVNDAQLRYEEMVKFPLFGATKKVIGIVSYTQDLTHSLSHRALYRRYRYFFNKVDAIAKAMAHLHLDECFTAPLTEVQFLVLLALASGRETKEIARCFDISQGRVESHIDALHDKAANRDLDLARSVIEQGRVQCAN